MYILVHITDSVWSSDCDGVWFCVAMLMMSQCHVVAEGPHAANERLLGSVN